MNQLNEMKNRMIVNLRFGFIERSLSDVWCPQDRAYVVDEQGNVHVFKYLGKNLHRGDETTVWEGYSTGDLLGDKEEEK